jgi:transposase
MRTACRIEVSGKSRKILQRWVRGQLTPQRLAERSRIVLLAAEGKENKVIAAELGVAQITVGKWRRRFAEAGITGIQSDAPRSGRPATRREELATKIVEMTTQQKPKDSTHWSVRTMAKAAGASPAMVNRVWHANDLKPHLLRTFKLSNDKRFVEKLIDIVGLYLNPPEHALVLCADEKSQIQALDRTQPTLPLKRGRCGTMTHDYKRNGTTTLFAAIEMAEGKIIGTCMKRHRHQEWIRFLDLIDRQTPADLDLHLIVDNYATHKHPKVQRWLARHQRFRIHFTPTSSYWLNLIERWFRNLTDKRIRRGVFRNVDQLIEAIESFIGTHNEAPKPFVWTAKAEDILAKFRRARAVLDNTAN